MLSLLATVERVLQVVDVIDAEAMPVLKRCSLAGHAELKTRNQIFSRHPLAADMLIDILVRHHRVQLIAELYATP